jgi:Tfp pilus assembly protein PilF
LELGEETLLYAGEFYWRVGNRTKAERKFREAIRLTPSRPEPYLDLARLHEEGGDLEAAVQVFEQALTACPENPALLKELGIFSARQNQGSQAEAFLRAAAALDFTVYEAGGDALMVAGSFLAAGEFYEQGLRREPTCERLLVKAAAAYRKASISPAIAPVGE